MSALLVLSLGFTLSLSAQSQDKSTIDHFLRDDFNSLENWKPFRFSEKKSLTRYSILRQGQNSVLQTISDGSASALLSKYSFNVYKYPEIRWRWKIDNIYKAGNSSLKSGDDFPMRIYIVFDAEKSRLSWWERLKIGSIKRFTGIEDVPYSCLVYVWGNDPDDQAFTESPFSENIRYIIPRHGSTDTGRWLIETADILKDYRAVFGEDPPESARVAIMNDSDNTGESSVSWLDYIEISSNDKVTLLEEAGK